MKTTLLTSTLLLAACFPLAAQQIQIGKDNKTIAISTSADADALADTAVVSIGFNNYGKDQDGIYADATRTSNAIIAALTAAGVPKDAIESSDQNLSSINPNNNGDKARYSQGLRFEFSQSWRVTVAADQAAKALHIAISNGANNSGNIQWRLKNDEALQAEAARKALEHARQIAASMAQGLGVKLGPLVYASNEAPPRGIFEGRAFGVMGGMAGGMGRGPNLKPLAISPDRITKSATVYAVFSIE